MKSFRGLLAPNRRRLRVSSNVRILSPTLQGRLLASQAPAEKLRKKSYIKTLKEEEEERVSKFLELDEESKRTGLPLQLVVGSVVERLPVILPDLEDWEAEFEALREESAQFKLRQYPTEAFSGGSQLEESESWVFDILSRGTSKFGPMIREPEVYQQVLEREKRQDEQRGSQGGPSDSTDGESIELYEGWDNIEPVEWGSEAKLTESMELSKEEFRPKPRTTTADIKNDTKSLDRALSKRLYLIVKKKSHLTNNEEQWRFPEEPLEDIIERNNEKNRQKLRDAARNTVDTLCEKNMEIFSVGNAPAGFVKIRYTEAIQKDTSKLGAQIFFYRAQSIDGHAQALASNPDILDYAWITKDELGSFVEDIESNEYWQLGYRLMEH